MLEQSVINLFGDFGVFLCVFLCSCLPVLETKVAIPLGVSASIWGQNAMTLWQSFLSSLLGSSFMGIVLVVVCHFFVNRIRRKKKNKKIKTKIENFLNLKAKKFQNAKLAKKILFLILWLALPVPFAGLYSGALLCVLLGFKFYQSLLIVLVGNLLNCLIVLVVCFAFKEFINLLLTILIILISLTLIWNILCYIYNLFNKKNHKTTQK